ncbi:DUF2798 domain-containing protein [Paenibacillus arenilitoris]|uniref:DUF2798 domain-containing protein n=1 Tax=Paenibacillus arenilitoris TaxID=2772299 RepID=A0A927H5S0_9BACL|nr:DUF2798 domain-containing protein [Paenibacillus arenilitoris]MBD2868833.1 DUF2798 domain-containing protein [Paenibacillus arenilitoris]
MKINKKYEPLLYVFLSALCMSLFISFILVSINTGYNDVFLKTWLRMWSEAFLCALPAAYFFPKGIRKLLKAITFSTEEGRG